MRAANSALNIFKKIVLVSKEILVLEEKQKKSVSFVKPVITNNSKSFDFDFDPSKSKQFNY